ncbi:LysM peptidoglycan-binding domain-containing protein [Fictibacillus gelatini]|uniref:LysM peptidoglycan-binding domain-containing protein n=1 Tax=Fictibacillus gelatini TaxID=225985 RepID=UPI0003F95079|nr:LysM peptidoglycan-binding domain-containing protein [Fictibacillus gelatini]
MAKLGKINLLITDESIGNSVDATSYPVEKGEPFTDHVQQNAQTISLNGYILGSDYRTRLQYLRDSMRKGEILSYTGRTIAQNVIILSIDDNRTAETANGSAVSIKLQFVRLVKTPWKKAPKKQKPQRKPKSNSGKKKPTPKKKTSAVYHKTRSGDTYWGLSKKYGTPISTLRKYNKYPDRRIPIGVKLRVK